MKFGVKQVNVRQRAVLVEYMERFPPLAHGLVQGKEDFEKGKLMWEKIAKRLNKIDPRVTKTGQGWNRYWTNLKFKTRKKYASIEEAKRRGIPTNYLSDLEERIKNTLTDNTGNFLKSRSERASYIQENFVIVDKKEEDEDIKDTLSNGNDESVNQCVTIDYDEDGREMIMPTEYITSEETHIIPDRYLLKNIKTEHSQKSIEDIKKDILQFQLYKQKELFRIEKEQRLERHKIEMKILYLRKEILEKQLLKLCK